MAQHKHNKPCPHRHSNLWWPSKAYKPVTVTEPPPPRSGFQMLHSPEHKTRVQEGGEEEVDRGRDGGPGPCNGRGPRNRGRAGGQGGAGRAGVQGGAGRAGVQGGASRAGGQGGAGRAGSLTVGSRTGAGSVGSRTGAGSGAGSVGSQNGAGSGADSVSSRNGAGKT